MSKNQIFNLIGVIILILGIIAARGMDLIIVKWRISSTSDL